MSGLYHVTPGAAAAALGRGRARRTPRRGATLFLSLVAVLCAGAGGCTHQTELRGSPFMTGRPEGARATATREKSSKLRRGDEARESAEGRRNAEDRGSAEPASEQALVMDSSAARVLEAMKAGRSQISEAARMTGAVESAAIAGERARALANPRDPASRLALARAYHHETIYDLALQNYEAARALAPDDPEIARDLGRLWIDLAAPSLALPFLEAAIRSRPGDVEAWSYRGIALDLGSRYLEGEEAFRRALELESRRWDLFNNLGYNLLLQERYAEAADVFENGLAVAPGHPVLLNNRGLALGFQGRVEEAMVAFRKAGPEAEAWNNLGIAHRFRGDLPAAVSAFERAARLDPRSRAIASNLREGKLLLAALSEGDPTDEPEVDGSGEEQDGEGKPSPLSRGPGARLPDAQARPASRNASSTTEDGQPSDGQRRPDASETP